MGKEDKYSVRNCRSSDDFARAVRHQGGRVENGGKHMTFRDSDGKGCVPSPYSGRDQLATGTQHNIAKALIALGFVCLAGCFFLFFASSGINMQSVSAWNEVDKLIATATPISTPYPDGTLTGCAGPAGIIYALILWILP